ncbi:MAG: GNAT family N-acetyltransferase [Chlamydiota bacterium]
MTIIDIENNLREKLKYIAKNISSMHVETLEQASLVDSKLSSDTFNTVFGGNITEKLAKAVFTYYEKNNQPISWRIGPTSSSILTNTSLERTGFTQDEVSLGMSCDLAHIPDFKPITILTIRTCETLSDFIDFSDVLSSVFDPVDDQVKVFYQKMAHLSPDKRRDMILFVGYEKEKPVATSCLFLKDVAGIYDIATNPLKRNLGYGSALFHHALIESKKRGYLQAVLQASPDGLNLYKRLGFEKVCLFTTWSNKQSLHKKRIDLKK